MFARIARLTGVALALGCLVTDLHGQTNPLPRSEIPLVFSTGRLGNPTDSSLVVFDEVIEIQDAPWIRLRFGNVDLKPGSFLLITSLQDGAFQVLDSVSISQWRFRSAYFNGPAVSVQLHAAPWTSGNRLNVKAVIHGELQPSSIIAAQCGPIDDRVVSDKASSGRLLEVGCTVAIYSTESCMITAGHCVTTDADTVEFNVPPSLPNGNLRHPPPEDQYCINANSIEYADTGVGNDWGLIRVFPNSNTALLPYEAQGAMVVLDTVLPDLPDYIDLVGYGIDDGIDNQVQQLSFGPITSITGSGNNSTIFHQADTEGGSSGSVLVSETTGTVIGIHTHGGCTTGGSGSNAGTGIVNSGLQEALSDYCISEDTVTCEDIEAAQAQCFAQGRIGFRAHLVDDSHSGDTITISLDGVSFVLSIVGRRVKFRYQGESGIHIIRLLDPPGCIDDIEIQCK